MTNSQINIKDIQSEILLIYKEIRKICERNHIRYFAVGGTELGAVRHHGFIPWDDDMDLGIPIDDFEKFKRACKRELPPHLEFLESYWMGGKVHNKSTTFLEAQDVFNEKNYHGIFVDIFIIIGSPNDPVTHQTFLNDMRIYKSKAFTLEHYPDSSGFTKHEILNWKHHITHDFPYENSNTLVMFSTGHYFFIDPKGLKNPIIMPFENTSIPVSSNYEKTLIEHYGDYKKLPPKNKQQTHSEYAIIDLKTPYEKYYKKVTKIDPVIAKLLLLKHKIEGYLQDDIYNKNISLENIKKELDKTKHEVEVLEKRLANTPLQKAKKHINRIKNNLTKKITAN